jgi:hypothetical protein
MPAIKTVSQLDANGVYLGPASADPSPLEPDVWLLPGGCIGALPPDIPTGQRARWTGADFILEDCPPVAAPDDPIPRSPSARRAAAYRDESDPLFFQSQRGTATVDDWLAKVAEIRARYPDPV